MKRPIFMSSSRRIILQACYTRSYRVETAVYVLVSTVNLLYVVYTAGTLGTHGSYKQGYTGSYIGRHHVGSTQGVSVSLPYDNGTVRVAKYDLRPHVYKFVNKEKTALKHLLMDEHTTLGLRGHNKKDTEQVGCKPGPWSSPARRRPARLPGRPAPGRHGARWCRSRRREALVS